MLAVLFDLDNTLYDTKKQVEYARRAAVKAMVSEGLNSDEASALALLKDIVAEHGSNYSQHYDLLVQKTKSENPARIIAAGVLAYYSAKRKFLKPRHGLEKTLKALRKDGYKLGVVSNGIAVKQWQKLIALGVDKLFDTVVISEEAKCCKPDKRIFELALSNLGAHASEALYVGDRFENDIRGAKSAGITTILYETEDNNRPAPKGLEPDHRIKEFKVIIKLIKQS